jgi:hypothetical protein
MFYTKIHSGNHEIEKTVEQPLTSREKRAVHMSQLRGSINSEYRRLERENNARAMRKKRSDDPNYREHERRQNRAHMAEIRRENAEYRQREHLKNRHLINSIYQTLETNLQSSHISFIPYQTNFDSPQRLSNHNEFEIL